MKNIFNGTEGIISPNGEKDILTPEGEKDIITPDSGTGPFRQKAPAAYLKTKVQTV